MTSIDDYKKADGRIDWDAYNAAQVRAGEKCSRCGHFIVFARGYRDECHSCKALDEDKGEVWHDDKVRCPKCRHTMDVHGSELYELYEEGTHDISCRSCDHDFEVTTRVQHSFMSPDLIKPEESAVSEEAK